MRNELLVEGLGTERVLGKLAREHIPVLAARRVQKNALAVTVAAKDSKKVFAILEGPCYNITKVRPSLFRRLLGGVKKYAGLLAGAALFLAAVRTLEALSSGEYGDILRAKGYVDGEEGWIYFDYVPGEPDLRTGEPSVTGRLCVIGCHLAEDKLKALFLG